MARLQNNEQNKNYQLTTKPLQAECLDRRDLYFEDCPSHHSKVLQP